MLLRLAGNALWLGRYLERSENLARLVGAVQGMTLTPEYRGRVEGPWLDALAVVGGLKEFTAHHPLEPDSAAAWLLTDRTHYSSLFSNIRAARDNARTARHLLTDELWEAINGTWLEIQNIDATNLPDRGIAVTCAWAVGRCQQIRGAADDLLRDTLPQVILLGQSLERSDYVSRLLSVFLRGDMAVTTTPPEPGTIAHRRWETLLEAGALLETYRRSHTAHIDPVQALTLVLAHPTSPRSLVVNARRTLSALDGLSGPHHVPTATQEALQILVDHLESLPPFGADLPGYLLKLGQLADAVGLEASKILD